MQITESDNQAVATGETSLDNEIGRALPDAECLLFYAAESGIPIGTEIVAAIIGMRAAVDSGPKDRSQIQTFLSAYTELAGRLNPVTANSIRACEKRAGGVAMRSAILASLYVFLIIFLSYLTFTSLLIRDQLQSSLSDAQTMAAQVRTYLDTTRVAIPTDPCSSKDGLTQPALTAEQVRQVEELRKFSEALRQLYISAERGNWFVGHREVSPLDSMGRGLEFRPSNAFSELPPYVVETDAACHLTAFQLVGAFASNVATDISTFYGAIASYLVPVSYSVLGAMAYWFRVFPDQVRRKVYTGSSTTISRIVAAIILGTTVSLFDRLFKNSPLAPVVIAFMAGYGVDVFFAFLDSQLQTFGVPKPGTAPTVAKDSRS